MPGCLFAFGVEIAVFFMHLESFIPSGISGII